MGRSAGVWGGWGEDTGERKVGSARGEESKAWASLRTDYRFTIRPSVTNRSKLGLNHGRSSSININSVHSVLIVYIALIVVLIILILLTV